ncbi:Transcriptional regulator, LysR family (plasmid) [Neorhizobium galegae bv. officinalis bv. officinalis str. HAMBI 1141]|uniref:Transcriptional regulator, LysR family n=2 Tax=Rhizobium/Agrobacterium group TaxID=227290 RepID=A0A068THE6_NEOGA|nr:Transcriptional regulator, LysR family [Neorhizobium galegae bv. officinalis bv. officinalis str. HAMBI 1141]
MLHFAHYGSAMEIKQLEVFLAVMSAGSITAAARLLDRSQSQVTRLIQELESSVGFALFDRNGPRITPTSRAVAFHSDAERFLTGIGQLKERARNILSEEPAPIEIAAIPAFASGLVPLALAEMPADLIPRNVHLRSISAEAAVQSVLARTADFCVASLPVEHPGLDVHGLFQAPCVAAVAADDPLAGKDVISVRDLADRCLITMANPFRLRRRVNQALQAADVRPSRVVDTNAALNALQLASTGFGVSIVEPATAYGLQLKNVEIRPLDVDIPFLWGIFSAASKPLSEGVLELIQLITRMSAARIPGFVAHDPGHIERVADATFGAGANAQEQ